MLVLVVLLAFSALCTVNAHPRNMLSPGRCERSIAVGATIMGRTAVSSLSSVVTVTRKADNSTLSSGISDYVVGELLTVQFVGPINGRFQNLSRAKAFRSIEAADIEAHRFWPAELCRSKREHWTTR
jgi:hypothetical protein